MKISEKKHSNISKTFCYCLERPKAGSGHLEKILKTVRVKKTVTQGKRRKSILCRSLEWFMKILKDKS